MRKLMTYLVFLLLFPTVAYAHMGWHAAGYDSNGFNSFQQATVELYQKPTQSSVVVQEVRLWGSGVLLEIGVEWRPAWNVGRLFWKRNGIRTYVRKADGSIAYIKMGYPGAQPRVWKNRDGTIAGDWIINFGKQYYSTGPLQGFSGGAYTGTRVLVYASDSLAHPFPLEALQSNVWPANTKKMESWPYVPYLPRGAYDLFTVSY